MSTILNTKMDFPEPASPVSKNFFLVFDINIFKKESRVSFLPKICSPILLRVFLSLSLIISSCLLLVIFLIFG